MRSPEAAQARRKQRKAPTTRKKTPATKAAPKPAAVLDDASEEFLNAFTPSRQLLDEQTWAQIRDQVKDLTRRTGSGGPTLTAKYARALARHVGARTKKGHRTDDEVELFSDAAIGATYSARSGLSKAVRSVEIGYMRRIRTTLHPGIWGTEKLLTVGQRSYKDPYTDAEITALLNWCRHAKQPVAKKALPALLLGIACGLDSREAPAIKGTDFLRTPWGLVVQVPGIARSKVRTARLIPVPAQYEDELLALAVKAKDQPLIARSTRVDYSSMTVVIEKSSGVPRLSGSRARMYWVRSLIANRVPMLAMIRAGVPLQRDSIVIQAANGLEIELREYIEAVRGGDQPFVETPRVQRLAKYTPAYPEEQA